MDLALQLTALKKDSRHLPLNERAELACQVARQLEKAGDYAAAAEALIEFWPDRTTLPVVDDLRLATQAHLFLRVGNVVASLESAEQSSGSQDRAKDLITKSIEISQTVGQPETVAEARIDLALCYWREGEFDEARVLLKLVLDHMGDSGPELRARALVCSAMVEKTAGRYIDSLGFYKDAKPFVEETNDHALKGSFHNGLATLLNCRGLSERRADFIDQSLIEFAAASFHFAEVGNTRYHARVEGNLGFLHYTIGRYKDAHEHLDRARRLFLQLKDVGTAAQVDETRARTLLAEDRLREAERTIKAAVKVLERGGQQAVLAEALTTHGAIAARMGSHARAALLLQRAIVVAETVGDREGSGRAHLTIVEELGAHTPLKQLTEIYEEAAELLEHSQDPATNKRLISCGRRVIEVLLAEDRAAAPVTHVDSWQGFSLRKEITKLEKILIERALRDAGGSVTKASQLLGFKHHQSLIGLINSRHRELLTQRSIVRRRRHHLFSEPKRSKRKGVAAQPDDQLRVLHVEDHKPVARLVKDALGRAYRVQACASGMQALEVLKTDTKVDVLIVDNTLPGISGLELVLRVRSLPHRRNLPIVMLSSDDVEKEAWRAGVDAFLPKTEAAERLAGTIERLSTKRSK